MFRTQFLVNEDNGFKDYSSLNVFDLSSKRIDYSLRKSTFSDINNKTTSIKMFEFSRGKVELTHLNQLYCLEHMPYSTDIVLPKKPNLHDWVVLFYEQTTLAVNVSFDKQAKIKLYGNGQRIMGFDEPLICDMQFMSLRLTFIGDVDGWVVS